MTPEQIHKCSDFDTGLESRSWSPTHSLIWKGDELTEELARYLEGPLHALE